MKISTSTNINLPADEVWQLAAERFGDTGLWSARLDHSHLRGELGVGAARVCQVGDNVIEEEIVAYHPDDMMMTYTLHNPPAAITGVTNTWSVTPSGSISSRLTMELDLDLSWWARPLSPVMRVWMKRILREAQEELVHWAENGQPHPRKQTRAQKAALR